MNYRNMPPFHVMLTELHTYWAQHNIQPRILLTQNAVEHEWVRIRPFVEGIVQNDCQSVTNNFETSHSQK